MVRTPLLAATLLAGLAAAAAATSPACVPHVLGSDGRGTADAIARSGDTLFAGVGAALLVLDASDETHPVQVAKLEVGQVVHDLVWSGTSTLAASGLDRLFLIDVADPAHPAIVGTFPFTLPGWTSRLAASAGRLYFTDDGVALHIVDASDPAHPAEVGSYPMDGAFSVAILDQRAYLAGWEGLRILDVSDPAQIVLLNQVGLSGYLTLSGNGRRLAVAAQDVGPAQTAEVVFTDIDDPDHPVQHGSYTAGDGTWAAALVGGRAYLTDGSVLDLADLDHPVLLGWLNPTPDVESLVATGSRVYGAFERFGVRIWNVVDPHDLREIGHFPAPAPTSGGVLRGDLAVTLTHDAIRVFDVSDPARPALVKNRRLNTPYILMHDLRPVGDFAFAESQGAQVRIWDLSDALHPEPAGSFGPPTPAGLAVDAGRVYVGSPGYPQHRIRIFDLGQPTAPMEIGAAPLEGFPTYVAAQAHLLAVAEGAPSEPDPGWELLDVANPASPVLLSRVPLPGVQRVGIHGILLVAADASSVRIYDIQRPVHPVLRATVDLASEPTAFDVSGSLAAVVTEDPDVADGYESLSRVHFLDLTDPGHPVEIATASVPGSHHEVTLGPGRALLANGRAGMSVLETCAPFADGFESGDASAWSRIVN
jgi:hypothetical protein